MSTALTAPGPPRSPWQLFYGAVLGWRRRWHATRARNLPRPVVSIGNLHWGGGGKTPLTIATAAHLRDRGLKVAILSRGYGGDGRGIRTVSTGEGPLITADIAGDEPVLMARELPEVAVLVGPDRHAVGLHALETVEPAPDVFVLDDGFSHLRLARDLEILVFPAADPFAGGRLAPAGRLREPLSSARLADAVVLTNAEPGAGESLAAALAPHGYTGPAFSSRTLARGARFDAERRLEPPARVIILSGIARPASFRRLAETSGFEPVAELALGDHHAYPEATLVEVRRLWDEHDAEALLTTSKDLVKLVGRLDLPLAELPIEARPEPELWRWLDERLESLR